MLAVALDASTLAHSAGPDSGFADLRVVDPSNRQIPYIVEQALEPLSIDLTLEKASAPKALPATRGNVSIYRLKYPVTGFRPAASSSRQPHASSIGR